MTPETLHQRILLHELRTILLDETRDGDQIPEEWKRALQEKPHEPEPYLILADWLEEAGSDLGELCRIQVELIGLLPPELITTSNGQGYNNNQPPFFTDAEIFLPPVKWGEEEPPRSQTAELVGMRMFLYSELYPSWGSLKRERKLGRTTRMLTDVLRYCCLNQGKIIAITLPDFDHAVRRRAANILNSLLEEFLDDYLDNDRLTTIRGNTVHIGGPHQNRRMDPKPDITFTDHACPQGITDEQIQELHRLWQPRLERAQTAREYLREQTWADQQTNGPNE